MTRCGLHSLSWNWFLAAYVALIAVLLFAVPAHAAHCRGPNGRFIKCPPPPPPTQTCPDGTIILATATCPAPAPTPGWVAAPLTNGGYARCKAVGGCHSIGVPYPPIIAQSGDVLLQKWNGIAVDNRQELALYPIGQWMVAGSGLEGYQDEWEGVAPAP